MWKKIFLFPRGMNIFRSVLITNRSVNCIQNVWRSLSDSCAKFMMVHVLSSGFRWSLWNELLQKHNWNAFGFVLTRRMALTDLCAVVLWAGVAQHVDSYVCACVFLEGGEEWSECALPEELCGDALPDDLWPQLKKEALTGTVFFLLWYMLSHNPPVA